MYVHVHRHVYDKGAQMQITKTQVVLKQCRMLVLNDEDYRRWVDEMRILKSLNHINIVKARDLPQGTTVLMCNCTHMYV